MYVTPISSKVTVDTVLNAASVAAGTNTGWINLNVTTERKVYIAITIDKQPWTVHSGAPWGNQLAITDGLYPKRSSDTGTFTTSVPAVSSLVVPTNAVPANLSDADRLAVIWDGASVRVINNHATDVATVTIKVVREWN